MAVTPRETAVHRIRLIGALHTFSCRADGRPRRRSRWSRRCDRPAAAGRHAGIPLHKPPDRSGFRPPIPLLRPASRKAGFLLSRNPQYGPAWQQRRVVDRLGTCGAAAFRTLQKSSAGLTRLSCRAPSNPTRIFTATGQTFPAAAESDAPRRGGFSAAMAVPFAPWPYLARNRGTALASALPLEAASEPWSGLPFLDWPEGDFSFLKGHRHEQ